jgi:hypothetical protein
VNKKRLADDIANGPGHDLDRVIGSSKFKKPWRRSTWTGQLEVITGQPRRRSRLIPGLRRRSHPGISSPRDGTARRMYRPPQSTASLTLDRLVKLCVGTLPRHLHHAGPLPTPRHMEPEGAAAQAPMRPVGDGSIRRFTGLAHEVVIVSA